MVYQSGNLLGEGDFVVVAVEEGEEGCLGSRCALDTPKADIIPGSL